MASDSENDYGFRMSRAPESDIVKFTLKSSEGKVVRALKSALSSRSAVFKVQFSKTWDTDTIELDEEVNFDQLEIFGLFIDCLVGWQTLVELTVHQVCCVYYYANKYEIQDLKNDLLEALSELEGRETVDNFSKCLELVSGVEEFVHLMEALDKIELDITSENGGMAFDIASKHKMARQKVQVVEKLKSLEYKDSWSSDLLLRIAIANRKELTTLQKSGEAIANDG